MEGRRQSCRQSHERGGAVSLPDSSLLKKPRTLITCLDSVSRDNLSRIDDNADLPPRLEAEALAKRFRYLLDRDSHGANFADFNPEEYQRYLSKKKDVDLEPDFETTGLDPADLQQTNPRPLPIYRAPENTDFYSPPAPAWRDVDYEYAGDEPSIEVYQPPLSDAEGRNLVEELHRQITGST